MNSGAGDLDLEVFRRYAGRALPRHVAYPMPTWWHDLSPREAAEMLRESRQRPNAPHLSLYIHVPFCEHACRYCACTRIPMEKCDPAARARTAAYVEALRREIQQLAETFGDRQTVRQIHWGGGTPTYLEMDAIAGVHDALTDAFRVDPDAEIAMELDPRATTRPGLERLRELGFNRVSLGIQDFDPRVQEHVNRVQPFALVEETLAHCRALGFRSVNFDLIYGLPFQTVDSVRRTLEQTISLSPDRIAYYQYAQIPDTIAEQRGMDYTKLPDSEAKLAMYRLGQEMLPAAGYLFIGLDHFAKEGEPLAIAMREGTLQRNFQGMTTGGGLDLVGVGASSIGHLSRIGFMQNRRGVDDYVNAVHQDGAVYRGKRLTDDDIIRQAVIRQIYCEARLCPAEIEAQTGVAFDRYFVRELGVLEELERDGLLAATESGLRLTDPLGRVLMRTVGAVFDAYLEPDAWRVGDRQYFSAGA